MSEQSNKIVVVDIERVSGEKIANYIEFLGFEAIIVADETEFSQKIADFEGVTAVLVKDNAALNCIKAVVLALKEAHFFLPCFLLKEEQVCSALPVEYKGWVNGSLTLPISYKDLLALLYEAELLSKSQQFGADKTQFNLHQSMVGFSTAIQSVRELITQVAPTEATVLILGESGTGKEVVARNVHLLSGRKSHPFVPVNCGAIPADLLESELFGHEKGAFTGAISSRQGRFEIAEGGTLFLDEIGDMPMSMQVKLLRILQEHTFERVGSNKTLTTDVRILAATHQNLEQLVAEGKFRMDLYYRLNVFPIEVPPLRDRTEDIPLLIKDFIHRMESKKQGSVKLSKDALAALGHYSWPGNIRELSNLIERLAILFPNKQVLWSDLPDKFRPNHDWIAESFEEPNDEQVEFEAEAPAKHNVLDAISLPEKGVDLKAHLTFIESHLMGQALEQSDWVVARAAKLLNLQRTTLVEKMKKLQISRPDCAS